jgi:sugar/nucleoside kinase (ribokinase family)
MAPELSFDLLVAGEINPDLILTGNVVPEFGQVEKLVESSTLTIGSSSAIFACGAARLGLRVAFIGACGDDVFGRFMLDEMQRRDVDISHVMIQPDGETGFSVILNKGTDRAILTHIGLIAALQASDISDDLLRQARHLHVASYFLQTKLRPDLPDLFQRAHSLGLTTSLDTNYDPSGEWLGFDRLLAVTDVFMPNQTEALSITKASDAGTAARQLAQLAETVVVKLGADGALACCQKGIVRSSAPKIEVVDTVGAGDSFDAGFLYGYLNHWELKESLRLACICGALSTRQAGGTNGQPNLKEAMSFNFI